LFDTEGATDVLLVILRKRKEAIQEMADIVVGGDEERGPHKRRRVGTAAATRCIETMFPLERVDTTTTTTTESDTTKTAGDEMIFSGTLD
jgi:hypothetical protein